MLWFQEILSQVLSQPVNLEYYDFVGNNREYYPKTVK
jgi:hypothetical protein